MTQGDPIERVHRAIEDIAAGKMVILVDDEHRENEGDLVMAADKVSAEAVNFMARYGRGLICLAMEPERIRSAMSLVSRVVMRPLIWKLLPSSP